MQPSPQRVVQRYLLATGSRVLFHIGRHPAIPQPKQTWGPETSWKRPWLEDPVREVVFLTSNPAHVSLRHGVGGHVYAYRVPNGVIQASGGLHRHYGATEILIPGHLWPKVKFLGKTMEARELVNMKEDAWSAYLRTFSPQKKRIPYEREQWRLQRVPKGRRSDPL